ncbi:hypothetical protein C0V70_07615 [Bacteriovorax stolpii]|uniref:Uncharacterized protein n=1 Tax=Bacteriovorax stolpii TaxID=960 RepID=A0A2K9NR19_BACTC|nr:LysR family transcriptional regulator [Bacteriovorax stolpii]AUN97976.1 hypothetical protein C0V70_07615 [Bacteriovorax stolpii]TDP51809.1 DNA-binding transcriptional LysR family regulator [Bacteriovorax stolpii]
MENFTISPDDCLILRAFKEASSLREAAKILNCDPAGLQRKTQRISEDYGLIQKIDGRWGLTDSGLALVGWVEESIAAQKKVMQGQSTIRIASTMWLVEQFLIPHLSFFPTKAHLNISTPGGDIENHLITGACDFVIVCHPPEDPAIAHKQLFKEEWLVVTPVSWKTKGQKLSIDALMKKPFIRHEQMNPDIFSFSDLSAQTVLTVDSLIGVRSAVLNGVGWSVVPKILVHDLLKEKKIALVEHEIEMDRKMCVWWLRRRTDSKKLSTQVCQFLQTAYDKLK